MADEIKQRNTRIFRGIKHHLNELNRLRPEYELLMIAAQGSQNYNLDLQSVDYKSDIDTVAIVLPPFENFVNNKKYISETIILDNNEHIDVKDIRQIFDIFLKQNIKYLEILHTDFRIINPKYKEEVLTILHNADNISRANPQKLITCTYGMAMEKLKALEHPYEGLKDKIEKYGYDGKQLHHIIRLFYFAQRFINNNFSFKYAMDFKDIHSSIYKELINAKKNLYSLEEARDTSKKYIDKISLLRKEFVENSTAENKEDITEGFLDSMKSKIFRRYFVDMFTLKSEPKKTDLVLPGLKRIWVTSDLHFGHENMLGFEPNRMKMLGTNEQKALVETIRNEGLTDEEISNMSDELWDKYEKICHHNYIDRHDEELIRRWNAVVKDKDVVFILGDLSFRNGVETNNIIKRLKGRKILIKGNHENICMDKYFDETQFELITDYLEIRVEKYHFILSHYPYRVWNQQHKDSIHLFGHIHSNDTTSHPMKEEIPLSWNVGVDVNNYEPVRLDVYAKAADFYKSLNND